MKMKMKIRPSSALSLLLVLLAAGYIDGYKPVLIVHGVLNEPRDFDMLKKFIQLAHPGTKVEVIDLLNKEKSLEPMWYQVKRFKMVIQNLMKKFPGGVHLLCFSQGGLICRGVLSMIPNHNVHNFIALASPLAGQYGVTSYLKEYVPEHMRMDGYMFCYNDLGQHVSICNYWKDPHHIRWYLQSNSFLPRLNGETPDRRMKNWKKNFLRIKKLVLIGGPDDDVITPWQSSLFGFYDSNENIVGMRNQEFYRNDAFGLKTLDARGAVSMCTVPGMKHGDWIRKVVVFKHCMKKWLT